mmetsp:Transcript_18515/g.26151  ORF Transcript_18515/g.26151 Transcript_18515/m.26151 type:complete len:396 (-) Transcript_18515:229-1416(-)
MGFIHSSNCQKTNSIAKTMVAFIQNSQPEQSCHTVDWKKFKQILTTQNALGDHGNANRDLSECDSMGRSLILEVIKKDPPNDILEDILSIYPQCLTLNISAFFVACKHASQDVQRFLIQHVVYQKQDSCPYPWIVFESVTEEGARLLLEKFPQGVLQGVTDNARIECPLDTMLFSPVFTESRSPDNQWWQKLKLMLMVAEYGTVSSTSERKHHPIHILLDRVLENPNFFTKPKVAQHVISVLRFIQETEPDEFRKRDEDGNYPLHTLVKCKVPSKSSRKSDVCIEAAKKLILLFIQAHPVAAGASTGDGRLPLTLAIENGWPYHDELLKAAPDVLQVRDKKTKLFPFQTAACAASTRKYTKKSRKRCFDELDLTFTLLLQDPMQARGLLEGAVHG